LRPIPWEVSLDGGADPDTLNQNKLFFTCTVAGSTGARQRHSGTSSAISLRAPVRNAFIPDYRLAPEHVFPAAIRDVECCYDGLIERGFARIAVAGDSAGGALALVLLRLVTARNTAGGVIPVGAVALSPVTDLTLSGQTWKTRAVADPYFIESQAR